MSVKFLTDEWFAEVQSVLQQMGGIEPNEKLRNVVINVNAKEPDGSVVECRYAGCVFYKGHDPAATATLTTTRDLLHRVMIMKNMAEGMKAIVTKKAVLLGDSKQLMPLSAAKPSPSQAAFESRMKEMTAL